MSLEDLVARALAEKAQEVTAVPDTAALVARGRRARRRRRLAIVTGIAAAMAIGVIVVSPMLRTTAEPAPVSELPAPSASASPTALVGPGRGTSYFLGSWPLAHATFSMPAGWEMDGVWVKKSSDPFVALALVDVSNIYTDGCRWRRVDPQPGPSVDDLVSAYTKVPGSGPAEDVTIDGYAAKQIDVTVSDFTMSDCKQGKFGYMQHDNDPGRGDEPTIGADVPGERYRVLIFDVDGSRLVVAAFYPPDISTQERVELDSVVSSIEFG